MMGKFQYAFYFLFVAAAIGALGLLPVFAKHRRRLLLTSALFALFGGVDFFSGVIPALTHASDVSTGRTLFWMALWIAVAILGNASLNFILGRWIFPERGRPKARKLFADLLGGLIYFVAALGILRAVFGTSFEGLLATSGIAAIVIGLALQSTLSDLFAGIALNIERPFHAGDWISLSDGPEGRLQEINWRAARLKSRAGDIVVIPNSTLARSVVANRSRPTREHVVTANITFGHEVDPDLATDILLKAARRLPHILRSPEPSVYLVSNNEHGITYELDIYIRRFADAPLALSEALREIWLEATGRGVRFAAPLRRILNERSAESARSTLVPLPSQGVSRQESEARKISPAPRA